jgi:hypothetical protein
VSRHPAPRALFSEQRPSLVFRWSSRVSLGLCFPDEGSGPRLGLAGPGRLKGAEGRAELRLLRLGEDLRPEGGADGPQYLATPSEEHLSTHFWTAAVWAAFARFAAVP